MHSLRDKTNHLGSRVCAGSVTNPTEDRKFYSGMRPARPLTGQARCLGIAENSQESSPHALLLAVSRHVPQIPCVDPAIILQLERGDQTEHKLLKLCTVSEEHRQLGKPRPTVGQLLIFPARSCSLSIFPTSADTGFLSDTVLFNCTRSCRHCCLGP